MANDIVDTQDNNPNIDNSFDYSDILTPDEIAAEEERQKTAQAVAKREALENSLTAQQNIWGYSSLGIEARKAAMTMLSTKTGLYSRIPLVCKGNKCPYLESCSLNKYELTPVGEYCPLETAHIEMSVQRYAKEFDILEEDFTDQNILREIVNLEIMMERCKSLMAKEQNPIVDVITGITEDGEQYTHPEVSKAFDMYERCQKQHTSLLGLMNATRKDKAAIGTNNATNTISDIFSKIADIEANGGFVEPQQNNNANTTYVYCDTNIDTNK